MVPVHSPELGLSPDKLAVPGAELGPVDADGAHNVAPIPRVKEPIFW